MSESKTVQEVQKELIAAVQRGREQVRKGQEQVRKGQEQMRKGQEQVRKGVVGVVSDLAKSVAHSVPAGRTVHIPTRAEAREHAREMASHAIAVQRDLAAKAWHATEPYAERVKTTQRELTEKARQTVPYAERLRAAQRDLAERVRHADVAEQVAAAQRTLSERVAEAARFATPFVAEGRARLSHAVGARTAASKPEAAANGAGEPALAESREQVVKNETPAPVAAPAEAERKAAAATPKPATAKASPSKASTAKASTARAAGTSKPRTPKK